MLTVHADRLRQRLSEIDHEILVHNTKGTLWNPGARPNEITDAITRRRNHLAHQAITTNERWIATVIHDWHDTRPKGTIAELHRLVTDIAAWRERNTATASDPLGPAPTDRRQASWQQLERRIHDVGRQQISSLIR